MDEVMGFVRREAWIKSLELGAEKGVFPEFEANREAYSAFIHETLDIPRSIPLTPRNYETTTCAPTGTISLVAETSSGIEPNFSWAFVRKDTIGTRTYVHTLAAEALGINVDQTSPGIDRRGSHLRSRTRKRAASALHLSNVDQFGAACPGPCSRATKRRQLRFQNL
jgi:ribonucleoside-diphosphate reductase alpha chain